MNYDLEKRKPREKKRRKTDRKLKYEIEKIIMELKGYKTNI